MLVKGMEYVYAAMLLHRAGKPISEENLTKVLEATGIDVDTVRIKALVASLAEVDIDEAIKSSQAQIPVMAPPTQVAAPEEKKKEEKEEKKEKEEKEEAALEGLGALFG